MYHISHIHLKSRDPRRSAEWFAKALNFKITSDFVREEGDRFIKCEAEDGAMRVNFSSERNDERLPDGIVGPHFGIEHFGIDTNDLEADVARLVEMGAIVDEGPKVGRNGQTVVFLTTPDGFRIELIQPTEKATE